MWREGLEGSDLPGGFLFFKHALILAAYGAAFWHCGSWCMQQYQIRAFEISCVHVNVQRCPCDRL